MDWNSTFTKNLIGIMRKQNIQNLVLCGILDLKPSGVVSLLKGRNNWSLSYVVKICFFFGKSIDEMVFGDKDYVEKHTAKNIKAMKEDIKRFLVENKNYKTLGELTAQGYFDEPNIHEEKKK